MKESALPMVDMAVSPLVDRLLYYGAKFLGQAGQNVYLAALFVVAGTGDHAALGLSTILVATLIPAVVLGLPGGALADRLGAARGFVTGSWFRFATVLAGFLILPSHPELAWVIAFAYSSGSQVFTPSELALVPVVQPRAAGRAHSMLIALQYAGQGTGVLILAPALYFIGGPEAMLAGAVAALAALVVCTTLLELRLRKSSLAPGPIRTRRAFAFGETFRYFGREHRAGYAMALLGFKAIGAKCMLVALPIYMERDLGLGAAGLAYLVAPLVLGIGFGLLWSGRAMTLRSAPGVMRLAFMGLIVGTLALAALDWGITAAAQYSQVPPIARLEAEMNTTFVVAVPVALLIGLCYSVAMVSSRMVLTETAPAGHQARVFATQLTLTDALLVIPLVVAGIGSEFAGARVTLAVVALIGLGLFVLVEAMQSSRGIRGTPLPDAEPAPTLI